MKSKRKKEHQYEILSVLIADPIFEGIFDSYPQDDIIKVPFPIPQAKETSFVPI